MTRSARQASWQARLPSASPYDLALFRIVVCAMVLAYADVGLAEYLSALPDDLRAASPSASFPLAWLPIDPTAVAVAGWLLRGGALLGLVGWLTRPALIVATLAALYVLGVTQLFGSVAHHHHLLWFLAILAASPCADVLSLDARGSAPTSPSAAYGVPVWTARAVIAVIFFFPGLWKLLESGSAWMLSDNLQNQIHWKWYQHQAVSWLRVDRVPYLCNVLAGATVAFELSFPLLLTSPRWRHRAAYAAVLFHLGTELVMHVSFASLWPCYIVLIDARRIALVLAGVLPRSLTARVRWCLRHGSRAHRWRPAPALAVAALLVVGNAAHGALGNTQAWPLACYPTFQWLAGDRIVHLSVDEVRPDGSVHIIDLRPRGQKDWSLQWSVIGATHAFDRDRLAAYLRARGLPRPDTRLRCYRAYSDVAPEHWHEPPGRRVLIGEFP